MSLQSPFTRTPFDRSALHAGEPEPRLLAPVASLVAAARDPGAPVLRRLRLVGAVGRRVDELFQRRARELRVRESGVRAAEARARLRALLAESHAVLAKEVLPALCERGVALRAWRELGNDDRQVLARSFAGGVSPLLTPLTVDATHPFPCVASLALSVGVLVRGPRGAGERYVGIEVPPGVPRYLELRSGSLVPIEDGIGAQLASLLGAVEILCHHAFRVTREARPSRAGARAGPRTGPAVRLEVEAGTPRALRRLLAERLALDPDGDVDESPGPLDLAAVASSVARALPDAGSSALAPPLRVRPDGREAS
jgi:polyphosphate kinase